MKFRFITILHNLELENINEKDINIFDNAYISTVKDETLSTNLLYNTLGVHSINEFDNKLYFYINGNLPHIVNKEQMDEIGNQYNFSFLRKAQWFVEQLWRIKDNNIYIRDGFLVAFENEIEDGFTYKSSLSEIYTKANNDRHPTMYSKEELLEAIEDLISPKISDFNKDSFGGKYPSADHFFKSNKTPRMTRAYYFILAARSNNALPMKIVMYCTALECFFTTGRGEITHKIAERVAVHLGTSKESKINLFKLIKKAYGVRSTLVHGSLLKENKDELEAITIQLDEILRSLIIEESEVFAKKDNELETYFNELLF